jgi:fructose-bisphosphate aldolase class II
MPLANMRDMLRNIKGDRKALGSFSVGNMEMVMGAVKAAEETNSPVILQLAEARLNNSPLELFGPLMIKAASDTKVDIGVHLDHGVSEDVVGRAVQTGFTSVMFDGSHLPYEENVSRTRDIVRMTRKKGVSVEAELGVVGGSEDDNAERAISYTDPKRALEFCEKTRVDALAVAIGNAHGRYKANPELRFDILEQITAMTDVPLVLHGGSGISDEDFRRAIGCGIKKINIATAIFQEIIKKLSDKLSGVRFHDYRPLNDAMVAGAYESVKRHIIVFNFNGR